MLGNLRGQENRSKIRIMIVHMQTMKLRKKSDLFMPLLAITITWCPKFLNQTKVSLIKLSMLPLSKLQRPDLKEENQQKVKMLRRLNPSKKPQLMNLWPFTIICMCLK